MAHTARAINEGAVDTVFLDTGYVVALAVENDQYHDRAIELVDQIEQENVQLVTTRAVVTEIGDALASPAYRRTASAHILALQRNPTVDIVPLTEDLFQQGFRLYRERQDKEWGLTDCISFVTMRDRDLRAALTTDRDFEQAGFTALLRS
jgi:predicted nucleic acid-binding protein